ncbi:MAG: thioredoxin family protein [Pseudomonadota bacterium]
MQVRKYISKLVLPALFLLFANNIFAAETDFKAAQNGGAKSRIIASFYQDKNQQKLIAGFEIVIDEGWKIYAPDDSGFGVPPSFNFAGSTNIDAAKFNPLFPKATIQKEQIGSQEIEYHAYKDKIIIPLELEIADSTQETNLQIEVNYGLCKDICIPVAQKFSLTIPAAQIDAVSLKNIQQYLENKTITDSEAPQISNQTKPIGIIKALIIAFIGGAILNIMPCVLPVLSLKLLSVINHRQSKVGRIRFAFLATILGIVFSFAVFAGVAVFLKSIGNAVGWGFQFQNPYFLLFLLIILMVFIANLLGLFEFNFGGALGSILNKKITNQEAGKNIFIPNFLSGILAVLLATPCSAPFVGVAISFALSSNTKEIFLIFGSMSLGLALPYLFLIAFPASVKLMPKPGAWMLRAKQLMAGFLAATAIWLVYILIDNIGFIAAIAAGFLAILILLFFKIINKINLSKTKFILSLIIFAALIAATFIIPNRLMYLDKMLEKTQQENWIKFDETQIASLVGQGKIVVIDITADWCITCKANKLLVLDNSEVKEKLKNSNIVAMRGDLTKPDAKIFNFMKKYNRYGIPFNIVFGAAAPNGILISELLSKDALLKAIAEASKK